MRKLKILNVTLLQSYNVTKIVSGLTRIRMSSSWCDLAATASCLSSHIEYAWQRDWGVA